METQEAVAESTPIETDGQSESKRDGLKKFTLGRQEAWRLLPKFSSYGRCLLAQIKETGKLISNDLNGLLEISKELANSSCRDRRS